MSLMLDLLHIYSITSIKMAFPSNINLVELVVNL